VVRRCCHTSPVEFAGMFEDAMRNHGLVTRDGLLGELTRRQIDYRVERGLLVPVHPGVYRVAGAPVTWPQRLQAACLAAGQDAAVSHRAAIARWGIDGGAPGIVEIAVPRPQWHRLEGVKQVHRATDLFDHHVVVRDGIRITTPTRSLIDLGAVAPWWVVDRAYGHAVGLKLTTATAMRRMIDELGRKGRSGVGVMRRVLDERGDLAPSNQWLAAKGDRLLQRYGITGGVSEYEIWVGDRFVAKVDKAFPDIKFCIEWDGDERHLGNTAADVERQNAISEAGWEFRRFGRRHVVHEELYVVNTVRTAIETRSRLFLVTLGHNYRGPA
jgi:hypothetical protein